MKLSEQTDGIMPLYSPGGSTLQWGAGRNSLRIMCFFSLKLQNLDISRY